MRKLDIDNGQFGWIVASYTIAAGLAGLLASSIMDRFGRKSAFLTLYTGFLLGTLFCGLSTGYYMLLVARVLTGAFGGILGAWRWRSSPTSFPEERRGRATGILMSAFAAASVVGVPAGIYLGGELGWHVPFLVLAALGLPVLFIGMRVLPPLRDHLHHASHSHPWDQIVETFGHSNHLRAFALTVAVMLGSFSVIPYISLYLVSNVGVDETTELPWVFVTGGILTLDRCSLDWPASRPLRQAAGLPGGGDDCDRLDFRGDQPAARAAWPWRSAWWVRSCSATRAGWWPP